MTTVTQEMIDSLRLAKGAIQLSDHVLKRDPDQLDGQFWGRLPRDRPGLRRLLDEAVSKERRPWLRPLVPSLENSGGALERTLAGHSKNVGAVAITCDGRRVVSASADLTVKVWEMNHGKLEKTLSDQSEESRGGLTETLRVGAITVIPNSQLLVCAFNDSTPRVWDIESGKVVCLLEGHTAAVRDITTTPDGGAIVTASADHSLRVWRLKHWSQSRWTAIERMVLTGHRDEVRAAAVTGDGLYIVSAADDGTVRLWDINRGTEHYVFTGHTNIVSGVAVSPNGKYAASSCADGRLIVWNLQEHTIVRTLSSDLLGSSLDQHRSWLNCVVFTPDGNLILSGARDSTIKAWKSPKGLASSLRGHTGCVNDVAVTRDGRRAVSASEDHTLKVWNLAGEAPSSTNRHAYNVSCVAVSPDERQVATGSHDGTLKIWDLESGKLDLDLKAEVDRKILADVPAAKQVWSIAMLPGARALSAHLEGSVRVWDLKRGEERFRLRSSAGLISKVASTQNGRRVVTASNGVLTLWELEPYRAVEVMTIDTHSVGVRLLHIISNGQTCVGVTNEGVLFRWNLEPSRWKRQFSKGMRFQQMVGLSDSSVPVTITHDARQIVTGTDTGLRIWDLADKGESVSLICHPTAVSALAVSSNGLWGVSGHGDGVVELWDLVEGELQATFTGDDSISAIAVTSDGRTLIAGEVSGRVHVLRNSKQG